MSRQLLLCITCQPHHLIKMNRRSCLLQHIKSALPEWCSRFIKLQKRRRKSHVLRDVTSCTEDVSCKWHSSCAHHRVRIASSILLVVGNWADRPCLSSGSTIRKFLLMYYYHSCHGWRCRRPSLAQTMWSKKVSSPCLYREGCRCKEEKQIYVAEGLQPHLLVLLVLVWTRFVRYSSRGCCRTLRRICWMVIEVGYHVCVRRYQ